MHHKLIYRHLLHLVTFCHFIILLVCGANATALAGAEDFSSFFFIKKVCTYPISWTYADKLHTFNYMIYFHNVQQQVHKKTSNKTGFTLVCYSFRSIIFCFFEKVKQFFSFIYIIFFTEVKSLFPL